MVQEDLKKLIKMAELMEKYFLVYFLPRGNWENISESNENEVYKILKKYINEDCTSFDLVKFVNNEKEYFNLLPKEIKSISPKELFSMNQEVKDYKSTSFVAVCLERLFDSKFRLEYNKKTDNFLLREEERLRKEGRLKEFYKVDIVRDFLNLCSNFYSFMIDNVDGKSELEKDTPVWRFDYGKEVGARGQGDKIEKINNLYSGFKFYGYGEYSKLLIAYRNKAKTNFNFLDLKKAGLTPITEDDKLVKITYNNETREISLAQIFDSKNDFLGSLSKKFQDKTRGGYLSEKELKVIENNNEKFIEIDKLLHSRFKNDYIPQELDGIYNSSASQKTLREEIVELLLKKKKIDNKDNDKDIWTQEQCNKMKDLFISIVKENGIEKCKQITKHNVFEDFTFEELSDKDELKKHHISIMTLFEVLQIFGSKGYLKDGRSSTINLKSWLEIKNSYALNSMSLDTPVSDDEEKTVGAFIEDERIDDYEKTNLSNEIVDSLFDDNSYDSITSKFYGHDYFIDSLRSIISKFNNEDTILVFDANNEIDRTEFVINALNSLNKNQAKLLKQEIESRKINDKQIILSRYRLLSNKNTETLSLSSFLKLNEKTCEKFWFSICFESLKGKSSNNNSWRPIVDLYKDTEAIYSMEGETEIKKFIKASITEIYNKLINF